MLIKLIITVTFLPNINICFFQHAGEKKKKTTQFVLSSMAEDFGPPYKIKNQDSKEGEEVIGRGGP